VRRYSVTLTFGSLRRLDVDNRVARTLP
jgi:hypothetical protein